jgi:hypothetical protein
MNTPAVIFWLSGLSLSQDLKAQRIKGGPTPQDKIDCGRRNRMDTFRPSPRQFLSGNILNPTLTIVSTVTSGRFEKSVVVMFG